MQTTKKETSLTHIARVDHHTSPSHTSAAVATNKSEEYSAWSESHEPSRNLAAEFARLRLEWKDWLRWSWRACLLRRWFHAAREFGRDRYKSAVEFLFVSARCIVVRADASQVYALCLALDVTTSTANDFMRRLRTWRGQSAEHRVVARLFGGSCGCRWFYGFRYKWGAPRKMVDGAAGWPENRLS